MIILAIAAVIGALAWTVLVFGANMMSDGPGNGFQFGGTIIVAWIIAAVFILAWWFK